jgi:hypothetical protein
VPSSRRSTRETATADSPSNNVVPSSKARPSRSCCVTYCDDQARTGSFSADAPTRRARLTRKSRIDQADERGRLNVDPGPDGAWPTVPNTRWSHPP